VQQSGIEQLVGGQGHEQLPPGLGADGVDRLQAVDFPLRLACLNRCSDRGIGRVGGVDDCAIDDAREIRPEIGELATRRQRVLLGLVRRHGTRQ
jgi:hypothetical protein